MASQEWITNSNLGENEEETSVNYTIEYRPTTDAGKLTLAPELLSSNLPSEISLTLSTNNTISVTGILPKIDSDTEYYFTYRLKEVQSGNPSNVIKIDDRYFTFTSKNIPVTWNDLSDIIYTNNNSILEIDLKEYLNHPNGNETFKKVSGILPEGLNFNDNGILIGYIEENITDITEYKFSIRVYSNGVEVETLPDKLITISVDPEILEQKPTWSTEPNLGNVNKNEYLNDDSNNSNTKKISAMNLYGGDGIIKYELAPSTDPNYTPDITGLPPGLELRDDGYIVGTCTTTQIKDWYFGAYAVKIDETDDDTVYSDFRKFLLTTNKGSAEHEIEWIDPSKVYSLGTFVVGEEISLQLPIATSADGSIVNYSFSGTSYPKGIELSKSGLISGQLDLQDTGNYEFEIMARTDYSYVTRKFRMVLKQGLGESAIKLYLRINLEYKDEYTEIKDQLNPNTAYNIDSEIYNVSNFPKIDVATLKCYDREVLASMMNFGNPEIVRFGLTKSLPYSHIDGNGNLTANYEVFYKSVDENTYQWDPINCGNYDFQAKLDQLKTTGEIQESTETPEEDRTYLDFNKEYYKTSVRVWKLLGEVETYSKLLACNITELKSGYFAKVLKDENHENKVSYYTYNGDPDSSRAWDYVGETLPQSPEYPDEDSVNPVVITKPDDSYAVFNFENVRKLLSKSIYVKQLTGTYYYDVGSQKIITPIDDIIGIKKLWYANKDVYKPGEIRPFIKAGEYYITDEDAEFTEEEVVIGDKTIIKLIITSGNPMKVKYESHVVSTTEGEGIYNVLFKPQFNSPNFMVYVKGYLTDEEGDAELYHLNQITDPWCFDFNNTRNSFISIDGFNSGDEMVMPNIKTSDVNFLLGGSPYVVFLDTSIEPLPMWKRKQADLWKPYTTYKPKDIIIYNSIYYKVKQQFTSGNEFVYDTNLLEQISGDVIDAELPKNYFPTLDLGYYQSGTNRRYLKDLNASELEGNFWYRKDFLFWELIAEPVYNKNIDTFGIPFYSTQNRMEYLNKDRKTRRTFEIDCDTPNAEVIIDVVQPDGSVIPRPTPVGNKWIVEFDIGSHVSWSVSAGSNYYPESGDYVLVSSEKHVISLKKKCVVSINPTPADATVTLTAEGYTQEGNTITVREGTEVHYSVEKEGYLTISNDIVVNNDNNIKIELKHYNKFTLRVTYTVNSEDLSLPVISLTGEKAIDITPTTKDEEASTETNWIVEKSIKVPEGNYVTYNINKLGYKIKKGNIKITEDNMELFLSLNDDAYTFTVNAGPNDPKPTYILTAEHPLPVQYPTENSIMVSGITSMFPTSWIKYVIKQDGYETVSKLIPYISSDTVEYVTMKKYYHISTSVVYPEDGVAKITNIIGARNWESAEYYDLHAIVKYGDKFYNANQIIDSDISFDPTKWDEVTSSAWVVSGYTVEYEGRRTGYTPIVSRIIVTDNVDIPMSLLSTGSFCVENVECLPEAVKQEITDPDPTQNLFCMETNEAMSFQSENSTDEDLPKYSFSLITNPEDVDVSIACGDYVYHTKEITDIPEGEYVEYTISKINYKTEQGNILIAKNTEKTVDLELVDRTLSIVPNYYDAVVSLWVEGHPEYVQYGNGITVQHGTEVNWKVTKKYYSEREGSVLVDVDSSMPVTLTREKYILTFNVTPSENTHIELTATGYPSVVSDNGVASIEVDSETNVSYLFRHDGYVDKTGVLQALKTETVNMDMTPTYTFTITPKPSNAIVSLEVEGHPEYVQYGNSIIVPDGTEVKWTVSADSMYTQTGYKTVDNNYNDNITLHYISDTVLFESATPGSYPLTILVPGTYYIQLVGGGGAGYSYKTRGSLSFIKKHYNMGGGSGAYVNGRVEVQDGLYTITVASSNSGFSSAFEQIAYGGGQSTTGDVGGAGGTYTVTSELVTGEQGNPGGTARGSTATAGGGASLYGGYGEGGYANYSYGCSGGTSGYVKIIAG